MEVPPEIWIEILNQTDSVTNTACFFVCKDFSSLVDRSRIIKKKDMCCLVAESGYLEVLKWCRANGCPWDEQTCAYAANAGHLEVLKYCRENGCPWNEYTLSTAISAGHQHIVKYCKENKCSGWEKY
jgi:hypothetical protein